MNFFAKTLRTLALLATGLAACATSAQEGDTRFDIVRFDVVGNTLLAKEQVDQLVSPFVGRRKVYGDIQRALEALDNAYRSAGFGTVQVYVPEQELTSGIVRIQVTEARVGKVTLTGNTHFDEGNIRNSLPLLKEGAVPNMRALSEKIQLANENPAKKVEVTFGISEEEDKVDAKVEVKDEDPVRTYVTLDNTGSKASGVHRMGVSFQHANIGNADQVLTLGYITALDPPQGVKVDVFSAGFRLPMYEIGDSIDLIYANSSTNTPSQVLSNTALGMGIMGKGEVIALRYNHAFPRDGEYSSRLVVGLDYKHINSTCTNAGAPFGNGAQGSCTPYTVRPLSATYSGQWQRPGEAIDFNVGMIVNAFPMGSRWTGPAGVDRYSLVTTRQTNDRFAALRFGGSYSSAVMESWMLRAAVNAQYSQNPLPSGESIGLAGSSAVRGMTERAVSADQGYVANFELYTPNQAEAFGLPGDLKFLAFYDLGAGRDLQAAANLAEKRVAAIGLGFRYNWNKDIAAKFDLAHVHDSYRAGPAAVDATVPKLRGHFSLVFGF